jgi:hypothetical protein
MNTYEIIKQQMTKKSRPGTMGRSMELNDCCDLFVRIMHNITDKEESVKTMNADDEAREALLARRGIEELRSAGVLQ